MRVVGLLFALVMASLLIGAPARGDDGDFPYTAYANSDDVYVRSGPGKNYYPTEKLTRGEAVEVYRHDPGGWYAIRPTRGSFSWIPARLIRPTENHLGVVNGDRVVSRVGSRFSDVRDVIQVRLDRGEEVEILEVKTLNNGGQSEQWCKIAPPSGEFRWVFGKFVDAQPPAADRAVAVDDDRPAPSHKTRSSRPVRQTAATEDREYVPDEADSVADEADDPPPVRKPRRRTRSNDSSDSDVTLTGGEEAAPHGKPKSPAPTREEAFQAEIDAIDLGLSSMVVEEPSVWKFDDLENRAEKALDHAQTAVQRGKARLLLDRIAKFESIKRESDNVAQVETKTDRRNRQLVSLADGRPPTGLQQVEGQRFDAQGKLVNVVPTRPNAPPFAIANSENQVIALVTPAPGVNLRSYVGRQVGVTGQRGFVPELKLPHITVQRITPLESQDALAGRDSLRR
jgi:hypothetical protein